MPQMGYDMQEGTLVRWLVSEGTEVNVGDAVAEIETDKAVVELDADSQGLLRKILVQEGTTVPVGHTIAIVGGQDDEIPEMYALEPSDIPENDVVDEEPLGSEESVVTSSMSVVLDQSLGEHSDVRASPVARRLAAEMRVDLRQIQGTGPGGRITKDDVVSFNPVDAPMGSVGVTGSSSPADVPVEAEAMGSVASITEGSQDQIVPLTKMRQQIARVTTASKREKPHFYVSADIDMSEALALREKINADMAPNGIKITVNDMVIKASVVALTKFPKFNATFTDDGIKINGSINVGVAIAEDEGLVLPAILDCGDKSLAELSIASKDLVQRSHTGALQTHEYTGGTFGISNMGMFDVSSFVAIIHPPNTAMLAVGRVEKRPVVREDEVVVAQIMSTTLSVDHRVADGVEGAQFIVEVKRLLENPLTLLV